MSRTATPAPPPRFSHAGRAYTPQGKPDIITWPLRESYAVALGKPLWFHGGANDTLLVRTLAETVMQHIRSLAQESRWCNMHERLEIDISPNIL